MIFVDNEKLYVNDFLAFILGVLKHQLSKDFYENIEHRLNISGNENIVWGPNYQHGTIEMATRST